MTDSQFEQFDLGNSSFGFSAIGTNDLEASEYTLVTIAVDDSTSIDCFASAINDCLGEIVLACRRSQRADNLMIRVVTFGNTVVEHHGFKLLMNCAPDDYKNCIKGRGLTALNDAAINAIEAANSYAQRLKADDYGVNGLVVVITDGENNHSTAASANLVGAAMKKVQMNEQIDGGLHSILIGCDQGSGSINAILKSWQKDANFSQFIGLTDVKDKTFAKIAQFISRSISSQSQSLATGGPSQALPFDPTQNAGAAGPSLNF